MTPAPTSFESVMSILALSINSLDRHPPASAEDLNRLDLLTSKLDTIGTRAMRKMEIQG